jgi:hypothetical protein
MRYDFLSALAVLSIEFKSNLSYNHQYYSIRQRNGRPLDCCKVYHDAMYNLSASRRSKSS